MTVDLRDISRRPALRAAAGADPARLAQAVGGAQLARRARPAADPHRPEQAADPAAQPGPQRAQVHPPRHGDRVGVGAARPAAAHLRRAGLGHRHQGRAPLRDLRDVPPGAGRRERRRAASASGSTSSSAWRPCSAPRSRSAARPGAARPSASTCRSPARWRRAPERRGRQRCAGFTIATDLLYTFRAASGGSASALRPRQREVDRSDAVESAHSPGRGQPGRRRADDAGAEEEPHRHRGRRRAPRRRGARLSVRHRRLQRPQRRRSCPTWCCSTSSCRRSTGSRSCAACAPTRARGCCRWWC